MKGEVAEIQEKIEKLTALASSAVYNVDWFESDLKVYQNVVNCSQKSGISLVVNLLITSGL